MASGEAAQGSRQLMLELIAECPARRCEIIVRRFSLIISPKQRVSSTQSTVIDK